VVLGEAVVVSSHLSTLSHSGFSLQELKSNKKHFIDNIFYNLVTYSIMELYKKNSTHQILDLSILKYCNFKK